MFGTELARGAAPTHVDLGIGGVEAYVLSAAIALPLCFRRRYPLPVLLVVAVLFVVNGERATFAFAGQPDQPGEHVHGDLRRRRLGAGPAPDEGLR